MGRRRCILLSALAATLSLLAQESAEKNNYQPSIEGTIRGKYEYNTSVDGHRFQVRNARFSVRGAVSPYARYKAEIDLSDEGLTRMLDAFVEMKVSDQLFFIVGQQKIPFSTDNLRSPHNLLFANRSFIGKQLSGLRDVGATLNYTFSGNVPIELFAGVYNGKGLYNQKEWRSDLSYAFRGEYSTKKWGLSLNYNSIQPYDLRMHVFNAGVMFIYKKLYLESEIFYKHYQNDVFPYTEGVFLMASYDIPLPKMKAIESIAPRLRYDQMNNDNNGLINTQTNSYTVDDIKRSRITGGLNFNLKKPFINEIRLNYEHYFYAQDIANNDNKLVIEFITKF